MKKTFIQKIVPALLALGMSTSAWSIEGQAGIDITVSDETAKFGIYSNRESAVEVTTLGLDYFFNETSDYFLGLHATVMRKGIGNVQDLELGVKTQLFYLARDQKIEGATDATGLMLGFAGRYWLPTSVPVALATDFSYSPRIVTTGDGLFASDFNLRTELKILPTATAYIGFRQLSVEFQPGEYELDKNMHIGVQIAIQ